jgi:hypothetical protein
LIFEPFIQVSKVGKAILGIDKYTILSTSSNENALVALEAFEIPK